MFICGSFGVTLRDVGGGSRPILGVTSFLDRPLASKEKPKTWTFRPSTIFGDFMLFLAYIAIFVGKCGIVSNFRPKIKVRVLMI